MKKANIKPFLSSFFSFYKASEVELTSLAVAYYLLISVFPILLTLANLLPYLQIDVEQLLLAVKEFFPEALYPRVADLIVNIFTRPSSSLLGISLLSMFWTLSKSMMILQQAFNKAYGVGEHRDFIIGRLVGLALGMALQVLVTLSVMLIAFGPTLFRLISKWLPLVDSPGWQWLQHTNPIVYLALFLALLMLYFFLPNVRISKIKYVLPGVGFVMVVMETLGQVFRLYVDRYANHLMDFRMVTVVIFLVVMLWFVFMAHILIIGAVLNASVQSQWVESFDTRRGDVASVLNRLKYLISKNEEKE